MKSISKKVGGGAALVAVALGGTGTALAAKANTKSNTATTSTTGYRYHGHFGSGNRQTTLTGSTLSSASAAAIAAVPGATVDFASKADADDSSNSNAAYEVHLTKADGTTHELVLEDPSFNVLSTTTETGPTGHGHFGGTRPSGAGATSTTGTASATDQTPNALGFSDPETRPLPHRLGCASASHSDPNPLYQPMHDVVGTAAGPDGKPPASATTDALLAAIDAEDPPTRLLLGSSAYELIQATYERRLQIWRDWETVTRSADG